MPSSAETYAVDTSVAVAALDAGHAAHAACRSAILEHRPALAGHAAFETYSVLTRMPGPLAIDPSAAADATRRPFPERCWLDAESAASPLARCGPISIVSGAIYDALVAEASRVNGRRLLTRDHRARRTYDLLGADHAVVG